MFVAAMLYGIFGPANQKFRIEIYYSVSFAALFSVLGTLLAVTGWKLLKCKQSQTEDLITPFYPWFRRVGWLFAGSFALDGALKIIQGNFKEAVSKIIVSLIVLFMTRRRGKLKGQYEKN